MANRWKPSRSYNVGATVVDVLGQRRKIEAVGVAAQLSESVIRVKIQKLFARLNDIEKGQADGTLGPRVARARVRILEKERKSLAAELRRAGYRVD